MRGAQLLVLSMVSLAALATCAPVLRAQQASPVAVTTPADSTAPARRVREFPIVFGGAAIGGGLGLLAGAAGGAALGGAADDGEADSIISGEGIGAVLGGAVGYALGAALGAHLTASPKPRPGVLPTIGVSVLAAAAIGLVAGGLGSAGLDEATSYVLVAAVPVAHLAVTSQFARWRAQRR